MRYTCANAVRMNSGCTPTVRFVCGSNQKLPAIEWMLPSNARPTMRPAALTMGLPELPPTMSLVVVKLARVFMSSCCFASSHGFGQRERRGAGRACVHAIEPRERIDRHPSLVPSGNCRVGESQGERRVGIQLLAIDLEARIRDFCCATAIPSTSS